MENRKRYFGEGDEERNGIEVNKSGKRHLTFINLQQRLSI